MSEPLDDLLDAVDERLSSITASYEWSADNPAVIHLHGAYTADELRRLADVLDWSFLQVPPAKRADE